MKILFLLLLLFTIQHSLAQNIIETDSVDVPYHIQIQQIFQNIDLSDVTDNNGLLFEHGFPLFSIENFISPNLF